MLKCRVFGGKTGQFAMGFVFHMVRLNATVRFGVEPQWEPTQYFAPVANTPSVIDIIQCTTIPQQTFPANVNSGDMI